MKYQSVDNLSVFEFHDAQLSLVSFENNILTVSVEYLNIHKDTVQNPSDKDMEIEVATMVFNGFSLNEYEPGRVWMQDENGNYYTDDPLVIYTGEEAAELFIKNLKHGTTVYDFDVLEDGRHFIDGLGAEPFFTVKFFFDHCSVYWDSYRKESWYEEPKWKNNTEK